MRSTRDRILDAARAVIGEHGLTRTTTREIAAAAGVAEGTLYRHFASQEAIFLAVLLERVPSLVDLMTSLATRVGRDSLPDVLSEVAAGALAFYRELVPLASAMFAETALLTRWREHLQPLGLGPHVPVRLLAEYLAAEQARGGIAADADPVSLSAMLFGGCLQRAYFDALRGSAPETAADAAFVAGLVHSLTRAAS